MKTIGIIGAGAWGTAIGEMAATAGTNTLLWTPEEAIVPEINQNHRHPALPNISLNPTLHATALLEEVVQQSEALILVTPAQTLRNMAEKLKPLLTQPLPLVVAAKGIELGTGLLLSEVLKETLPDCPVAILSGPNFAREVALKLPAAVTLACCDGELRTTLLNALSNATFRLYGSEDLIGAQIGGAIKNVFAIACGMILGANLGENARAALITRGLAEAVRLGIAKGAKMETFLGLSGVGDMLLTCTSTQSRNTSLGLLIGEGLTVKEAKNQLKSVTEGVYTASAILKLADKLKVEMPICAAINQILEEKSGFRETLEALLARPLKMEHGHG